MFILVEDAVEVVNRVEELVYADVSQPEEYYNICGYDFRVTDIRINPDDSVRRFEG